MDNFTLYKLVFQSRYFFFFQFLSLFIFDKQHGYASKDSNHLNDSDSFFLPMEMCPGGHVCNCALSLFFFFTSPSPSVDYFGYLLKTSRFALIIKPFCPMQATKEIQGTLHVQSIPQASISAGFRPEQTVLTHEQMAETRVRFISFLNFNEQTIVVRKNQFVIYLF